MINNQKHQNNGWRQKYLKFLINWMIHKDKIKINNKNTEIIKHKNMTPKLIPQIHNIC